MEPFGSLAAAHVTDSSPAASPRRFRESVLQSYAKLVHSTLKRASLLSSTLSEDDTYSFVKNILLPGHQS